MAAPGSEPVFRRFAQNFHQDVFEELGPPVEAVESVAQHFSSSERLELVRLIKKWTDELTNSELVGVWRRGGSSHDLQTKNAREFFEICGRVLPPSDQKQREMS